LKISGKSHYGKPTSSPDNTIVRKASTWEKKTAINVIAKKYLKSNLLKISIFMLKNGKLRKYVSVLKRVLF